MYRSEIRPSKIKELSERSRKLNYKKYLSKVTLVKCRAFKDQAITFDFPVTALIGPNGGGKTTILGACALIYDTIKPRQFFARNRQLDMGMKNWSIAYEIIDREKSRTDILRRTASFPKEKWNRDAVQRDVKFFGVSRTLPAVERKDLSKLTDKKIIFKPEQIQSLNEIQASNITKILGKNVDGYSVVKTDREGNVTLLSGKTTGGASFSEFHFGAGESSIIKMVLGIESVSEQGLILIEEIENGLHPLAVSRLVDYLIDVADRKRIQIIFTTHSKYAISPLPSEAIWAAVDGTAIQGKLDIHSLYRLTGEVSSKLIIYTEDSFAREWVTAIIRSNRQIALDAIEIYPMGGDGAAVAANKHHNLDPSSTVKSICIIDGDSQQTESEEDLVYRLPGEAPETFIFDQIVDKLEECAPTLSLRLSHRYTEAKDIANIIRDVNNTNRDHHLLFSQIGERAGFISEDIVINAFLSTWCEFYESEVSKIMDSIHIDFPLLEKQE